MHETFGERIEEENEVIKGVFLLGGGPSRERVAE